MLKKPERWLKRRKIILIKRSSVSVYLSVYTGVLLNPALDGNPKVACLPQVASLLWLPTLSTALSFWHGLLSLTSRSPPRQVASPLCLSRSFRHTWRLSPGTDFLKTLLLSLLIHTLYPFKYSVHFSKKNFSSADRIQSNLPSEIFLSALPI